ncbi:MAG: DUF5711 family protein [Faecalibacterium sp.]
MVFRKEKKKNEAEPSEKQVDLVQVLRQQKRTQRRNRRIVGLIAVVALLIYLSGAFSAAVSIGKTWYESIGISFATQSGYPAQTGISNIYQVELLSGGFVVLGEESCLVYSTGGNRLRSIQSGYLRPTIAAGSTSYLLYQRAGNELRVESRTQTLYTKTYSNSILLASIADSGSVAVVTESDRYLASLTVYSATMQEKLSYSMTDSEGIPLRMEYSPDSKTLAIATISASGGQMYAQLCLISPSAGTVTWVDAQNATPLAIEWVSKTQVMVIYDNIAILYDTETAQQLASYSYPNKTLADYAVYQDSVVLLFTQSAQSEAVLLQIDADFTQETTISTQAAASSIALDQDRIYLIYEKEIESYTVTGEFLDCYESSKKILELLVADDLFLFTADTVELFIPPSIPQL